MYKVGICDDEKSTCAELEKLLLESADSNGIQFDVQIWFSGESLCQYLIKSNDLDLIFLDIQLCKIDGVGVGKFIRNELNNMKISIVYISHEKGYAMKLFKVQPLDFLVKPVCKEEMNEVIKNFLKSKRNGQKYFEYKSGNNLFKIPFEDILYFRSDNRKVEIIRSKSVENYYGKIKNIENFMPEYFFKINQSFIINKDYVKSFMYEQVQMNNGDILCISRSYRKDVREKINKYKLNKRE